jgi:hypothetical protein
MELRRLCAYNQTRECFLGLEVSAADISCEELKSLLRKLILKSGEGLWMTQCRGIPETDMHAPLDLIYLDEDCRAIEVVESYPTFRVSPSSPRPATILALPIHSIYSSQTQAGDQLVLCVAEEMQGRLERITSTSVIGGGVQSAVLLRGKPLWSGGPGVVELQDRPPVQRPPEVRSQEERLQKERSVEESPLEERFVPEKPYEMDLIYPGIKYVKPPRSWLKRWWSPDPRTAPDLREVPRESRPGLAAYYWTGGAPKAHSIKDISSSGLYVVTEERWYPGTLILMTLQSTEEGDNNFEHAISVHSRAVRWGNDGVGLQFVMQDSPAARSGLNPLVNGANRRQLEQFLARLRKVNG